MFISESLIGNWFGDVCYDFPNRTVCLHESMPSVIPAGVVMYDNVVVSNAWNYAESQYMMEMDGKCQRKAPWHLARVWQRTLKITDYPFDYEDGENVPVYILDTWISAEHPAFNGRVQRLGRFGVPKDQPPNGVQHGTHVAGLVGAWDVGVARASLMYSAQVLDNRGYGDVASIIQALHAVLRHQKQEDKNSVINLSIGGGYSPVFNNVLEDLQNSGKFVVVVAAGNENRDAADSSPASADVVVVGATTVFDVMASFSNYGKSVKILAPGESVQSLCPGAAKCYMSGTSMSSPIVAGIAASLWSHKPKMNSLQLIEYLLEITSNQRIKGMKPNTVNKMAFIPRTIKC